jgi:pilus assembly protein CpaB
MKNKRAIWMMTVAVILGLGAVVLASSWLLEQPNKRTTQIALATTDVSLGQRIAPDMIKLAEWPASSTPMGSFSDPAKLTGRVLKTSVVRGEPLVEAKLAPVGTLGGLSALIAEGRRAITVRVNDVVGVAGFALPGNFVDIIVHTEREHPAGDVLQQRKNQDISKIVLERILVLAVAQEVERDETKPKVVNAVTLEVTPEQAEALDLARSVGTLSLVLRNQVDPRQAGTGGATKRTLLSEAEPLPPPRVAPAPRIVKAAAPQQRDCVGVISGTRTTKECF